ncbi:hypothetical protein BSKO_11773 [Bryopsis sp. KO-2023]|nr:hypothetical protein BSKO_11773 [Bryopsis sp. KO-2023]
MRVWRKSHRLPRLMILFESVSQLTRHLSARSLAAFQHVPTLRDWKITGSAILGLGIIALPFGFRSGFLRSENVKKPTQYVKSLLGSFFFPGLFEEWIFRALLLPHPTVDAGQTFNPVPLGINVAISLTLFILYHFSPMHRAPVFSDRRFLGLAGGLGLAATVVYLTTGSLWTAGVTHWVPVAVWLLHLGGSREVGG